MMADKPTALTIFGKDPDFPGILTTLCENSQLPVKVSGPAANWTSAAIEDSSHTLTFRPMLKVQPGDQFSQIILGAANFFRRIKTDAVANQKYIKTFVFETKILIGVIAEPELLESAGHFDLIFKVAERCNGLIFNGSSMVDPSGNLILDKNGACERCVLGSRSAREAAE
jgi:hypothetical protein